jgi:hypothetical protein
MLTDARSKTGYAYLTPLAKNAQQIS